MPIVIEGVAELSDLLTTQTNQAAKRYLSQVAEPAAQVVIDAMKTTVPVKIGILEEALGWQKKWLNGDETTIDMKIGPLKMAYWGSFQEFGTRYQQGQHWMGRAWESCKDKVLEVFVTGAKEMIAKLKARNAGS